MSLPSGWTVEALSNLCSSVTDGDHQAPPKADAGIPFLVIGNVSRLRSLSFEDTRFVSRQYYDSLDDARRPRNGDILYSVTGSFGIPIKVDVDTAFCVQRHLAILRPLNRDLQRYIYFALQTRLAFDQAASVATGTAQKTVPLSGLRKLKLPVAPIAEQQRIVEALDSYLTRLDAATASLKRVEANLKRYRASVLKSAVEGRLVPTEAELARKEGRDYEPASTLLARILKERRHRWEQSELARLKAKGTSPKDDKWKSKYPPPVEPAAECLPNLPEGWCWATIGQISSVTGGVTKNAGKDATNKRAVPYLRVANVYANEVRLNDVDTIMVTEPEMDRTLLAKGDILVVEGNGSVDQIGRAAQWDGSISPCVHQNHLIKLRPNSEADQTAEWILTWMTSPVGRQHIVRSASSTAGLHTLSISKIEQLPIPLAPLAERVRICEQLRLDLDRDSLVVTSLSVTSSRIGRLRQSVLKWAFDGKLVDQNPNDEPASVLLDRIRSQNTGATTRARRS